MTNKEIRRTEDKIETLEDALALYPPEDAPTIQNELTNVKRESAGWMIATMLRRLMREVLEFHRLFTRMKHSIHWGDDYGLVKKTDVEAIDSLWKRLYHRIPESYRTDSSASESNKSDVSSKKD